MFHLVWLQSPRMGQGLISGYKPNRISLYLMYLYSDRLEELERVLLEDMVEYKINPNNKEKCNEES